MERIISGELGSRRTCCTYRVSISLDFYFRYTLSLTVNFTYTYIKIVVVFIACFKYFFFTEGIHAFEEKYESLIDTLIEI